MTSFIKWKVYPLDRDYIVSEYGDIISYKRKKSKILKKTKNNGGYLTVYAGDKTSTHRVVAETFISKIAKNKTVNHIDGNKENNHYSNLEIVSLSENIKHAFKNNLNHSGSKHGISKLNESVISQIFDLYKKGKTMAQIGEIFKINRRTVSSVLKNKTWTQVDCDKTLQFIRHKNNKITAKQASEIKWYLKNSQLNMVEIGKKFGVTNGCVYSIKKNKTWVSVKPKKPKDWHEHYKNNGGERLSHTLAL